VNAAIGYESRPGAFESEIAKSAGIAATPWFAAAAMLGKSARMNSPAAFSIDAKLSRRRKA
jgi:hypothetical protein